MRLAVRAPLSNPAPTSREVTQGEARSVSHANKTGCVIAHLAAGVTTQTPMADFISQRGENVLASLIFVDQFLGHKYSGATPPGPRLGSGARNDAKRELTVYFCLMRQHAYQRCSRGIGRTPASPSEKVVQRGGNALAGRRGIGIETLERTEMRNSFDSFVSPAIDPCKPEQHARCRCGAPVAISFRFSSSSTESNRLVSH